MTRLKLKGRSCCAGLRVQALNATLLCACCMNSRHAPMCSGNTIPAIMELGHNQARRITFHKSCMIHTFPPDPAVLLCLEV